MGELNYRHCCNLLLAVAKRADASSIYKCASEISDWKLLLDLAEGNRVLPMLFLRLAGMDDIVPFATRERLKTEYERNVFHNLANAAELIVILKALEHAGVPAMPFKGIVLGASIYGDINVRSAGDLDLLIRPQDISQSRDVLRERGFELAMPVQENGINYECRLERQADGMVVELSWKLTFSRAFKRNLGMEWIWPSRRVATIAGAAVPDMSAEITLLMLCIHGSKHVWSRLMWIYDVSQALRASPDLDWDHVLYESRKVGIWRCLALGALLAYRMTDAVIPQRVLKHFYSDTQTRNLAVYIADNLFIAPGRVPRLMPYGIRLLDVRDRIKLLSSPHLLWSVN